MTKNWAKRKETENRVDVLWEEHEKGKRQHEIYDLDHTIAYEPWWDRLDPEQTLEAIKYMKRANTILCARMGMSLHLIKWTEERR